MQKSSGLTQYSSYYTTPPYKIASIHRTATAADSTLTSSQVKYNFFIIIEF